VGIKVHIEWLLGRSIFTGGDVEAQFQIVEV
jgi:hypothetical protein